MNHIRGDIVLFLLYATIFPFLLLFDFIINQQRPPISLS